MSRRLTTLLASLPLGAAVLAAGLTGAGSASAAVLPPANPANHPLSIPMDTACGPRGNAGACNSASLAAINAARADEGVGPMVLPSNYYGLTPGEQLLVLFDLERTSRGEAPIAGLTPQLNQDALDGAARQTDPSLPAGAAASATLWAGGWGTTLYDDYLWMYDDGPGGVNIACCWGHRDAILASWPGTPAQVLMGAAVTSTSSYSSSTGVVFSAGTAQAPSFTWAAEQPYLTGAPGGGGYWLVASDGGVFSYGQDAYHGSTGGIRLARPIVGVAGTPDRGGYWLVASDGGVFSFGDARFHGSTGNIALTRPVVGMAADPATGGYWLVASDGGIFSFGAPFYGSTGAVRLNRPIVGMAATPDGRGYWLVASDGGIFSFGDARFFGSTGALALSQPIVGMARTPDGGGYWLVAADGGVFSFGDAHYFGSTGGDALPAPVVGIQSASDGAGYRLVGARGSVYSFGSASWLGSPAGGPLWAPLVGAAG